MAKLFNFNYQSGDTVEFKSYADEVLQGTVRGYTEDSEGLLYLVTNQHGGLCVLREESIRLVGEAKEIGTPGY